MTPLTSTCQYSPVNVAPTIVYTLVAIAPAHGNNQSTTVSVTTASR